MDFEFAEEHKLLRSAMKEVVKKELEPLLASYPKDEPLPRDAVLKAFKVVEPLGFLGARVPIEEGGSGLDHIAYGICIEETPPVLSLMMMAQEAVAARIYMGGSENLKKKFVPLLTSGQKIGGNATTEAESGSDAPAGVQTKAKLVNGEYIINGTKVWSTNASISDILMTVVSLGRDEKGRNTTARLAVEREVSPYQSEETPIFGFKQGHLSNAVFEDCHVPQENLIGESGDTRKIMQRTWQMHRVCNAFWALHSAQKAYDASVEYAKQRRQFGRVIGSFQLVQDLIVEMATLLETSRLLCYKALWLMDQGVWASKETSMAKYWTCEAAQRVVYLAMKVHGAYGISADYPLNGYLQDAVSSAFPDGTIEINKLIIGRDILGIRAIE